MIEPYGPAVHTPRPLWADVVLEQALLMKYSSGVSIRARMLLAWSSQTTDKRWEFPILGMNNTQDTSLSNNIIL